MPHRNWTTLKSKRKDPSTTTLNKPWAALLLTESIDEDLLNDIGEFTERQFHETAWIAKLAAQWLRTICADVAVSRGSLTAYLRRIWGLDTVLPELRYAAGLPVLDQDKKEIDSVEFGKYRAHWENHEKAPGIEHTERKLDKRIDHRQHAVDAMVIGLTDRSLYMRMASSWKQASDRARAGEKTVPSLSIDPPIQDVRRVALETLRALEVSHKHDRHGGGPLFKDLPWGVTQDDAGKDVLCQRKTLANLAGPRESKEKVRARLEGIEAQTTREAVLSAFDERIGKGKTPVEALKEPIVQPGNKTPIRRVRLLGDSADMGHQTIHRSRAGNGAGPMEHQKLLPHDGIAFLELVIREGKLQGRPSVVRHVEALKHRHFHHGDDDGTTLRFFKGDMVRDRSDGQLLVVGYIVADRDGQLMCKLHTETPVTDDVSPQARRKFSGRNLAKLTKVDDV